MTRSRYSRHRIMAAFAILTTMAGVAAASAYVTREHLKEEGAPQVAAAKAAPEQTASAQQAPSGCDDGNVLGYIAGGAAGGILGNQVGRGSGKAVATIGGALGGAYLGGKSIPLHNATCRQ